MEDVLDLYAEAPDPNRPVVSFAADAVLIPLANQQLSKSKCKRWVKYPDGVIGRPAVDS
jgi:hypothetical protein